jgi:hypothetical protein
MKQGATPRALFGSPPKKTSRRQSREAEFSSGNDSGLEADGERCSAVNDRVLKVFDLIADGEVAGDVRS